MRGPLTDKDNKTPLHIAAQNHHENEASIVIKVWLFLEAECEINRFSKDNKGKTAIQYIPEHILKEIDAKVPKQDDDSLKVVDAETNSDLQQLACLEQSEEMVPTTKDTNGRGLSDFESRHTLEQQCTEGYVLVKVKELLKQPSENFPNSGATDTISVKQSEIASHVPQSQGHGRKPQKQAAHKFRSPILPFKPESPGTKWEVEIIDNVQKQLETMNSVLKKSVFKTIQKLARGYFSNSKNKKIKESQSSVVFETRINKADRLLYALLDRFSETDTDKARKCIKKDVYVYKKKIVVLDIVLRHKQISHHAERVLAIITEQTKENRVEIHSSEGHQHSFKLPQISLFCKTSLIPDDIKNIKSCLSVEKLPEEERKEVDIGTKTYSLSRLTVLGLLSRDHERCEYPIKVTDDEFDIISKPESTPIVVLGRSGTGKTTTCLCRLWKIFTSYWDREDRIDNPKIPKDQLPVKRESVTSSDSELVEYTCISHLNKEATDNGSLCTATQHQAPDTTEPNPTDEKETEVIRDSSNDYEHLHQVFITKSSKLCNQLRRKFCDYIADYEPAKSHSVCEPDKIPLTFSEVDDLCFPLFLTARKFFLMVDTSLSDEDDEIEGQFFHKNDVIINLENPDFSHFLQMNENIEGNEKQRERVEVTASYFQKYIWKKIRKEGSKFDPLLVWTEIQSFIKGSLEALNSEGGTLSEEDYAQIGSKKAPSFSWSRSKVYKLFKAYSNLKHADSELDTFDNGDFIYHLYQRLKNIEHSCKWSIDYIYIDEVQDFTQAELSVIAQCCKNPNGFFFAGDTAQTIIKGVAFRFEDLTSIFYLLKDMLEENSKRIINVPKKPDQLILNHRSHCGITSLATTVTDLLKEFFPHSFDWQGIPNDYSKIDGPTPLFLCSKNLMEYFFILQDKSSIGVTAVEFGADQAVIVRDEQAREAVPKSLRKGIVLTVQQCKGLEFNDVLLYNFFTDFAQVRKQLVDMIIIYLYNITGIAWKL